MLTAADFPDPLANELIRILISGVLLVSLAVAAAAVEWLITMYSPAADMGGANSVRTENPSFNSTAAASIASSSMLRVLRRTSSV